MIMRQRVEKIGGYFRREFCTNFPPFLASDIPGKFVGYIPYEAYLFLQEAPNLQLEGRPMPYRAVGAACFRWQNWSNAPASWELSWVWFHPFARRRGHLSKAWPKFKAKYGSFHSEALSCNMEAFLDKQSASA